MRLLSTLTRSDHRHFPPPRAANSSPVHKSMATSMANFSFLLPRRVITITIIITPAIDNVFVRDLHSHRLWEPINLPIHQKKKTSSVHRHPLEGASTKPKLSVHKCEKLHQWKPIYRMHWSISRQTFLCNDQSEAHYSRFVSLQCTDYCSSGFGNM